MSLSPQNQTIISPTSPPSPISQTRFGTSLNGVPSFEVMNGGRRVRWPIKLSDLALLSGDTVASLIGLYNKNIASRIETPFPDWYRRCTFDTWHDLEFFISQGAEFFEHFKRLYPHFCVQYDRATGSDFERSLKRLRLIKQLTNDLAPYMHSDYNVVLLRPAGLKEHLDCIRNFPSTNSNVYRIMMRMPCGIAYLKEIMISLLHTFTCEIPYDYHYSRDECEAFGAAAIADASTPEDLADQWNPAPRLSVKKCAEAKDQRRTRKHDYDSDYRRPTLPNDLFKGKFSNMTGLTAHAESQQDLLVKEENTTFSDQREETTDTGYVVGQIRSTGRSVAMDEEEWHVRNIMSKPMIARNLAWTTSQPAGDKIADFAVPGQLMMNQQIGVASQFTFFRGHPRLRIQLNGTKFHRGRLMACFVPRFSNNKYDHAMMNMATLCSLPHVMLDASFSNTGILEIPFVHQNSYFNTGIKRPWQTLGNLQLWVFNSLSTATTTTQSVSVTIWISFDDCELHQPCQSHTFSLPIVAQMETLAMAEAGAAALNTASSLVSSNLGTVSGGITNNDKPTDPIEIARWVPNAVTSLAYGEGIDRSMRLGLQPTGFTLPSADLISTTTDDMDLSELCKIPGRILAINWTADDPYGKLLTDFPVSPVYCNAANATTKSPTYHPTTLAYCSRPFKYWRGAIKYKVQIIASQMHAGRLAIVFAPGAPASASNLLSTANSYNTFIVDLEEKAEVEFSVNYMCEKPWLRSDSFMLNKTSDLIENNQSTGNVFIYVLNRLVAPASVSSEVTINVFVSAGNDFELACPCDIYCTDFVGTGIKPKMIAHSLATQATVTTRTSTSDNSVTRGGLLVQGAGDTTMGENCMDLKTLLRRYELVATRTSNIDKTWNFSHLQWPNSPNFAKLSREYSLKASDATAGMIARTHLAHFSELFTFWRGSLRYKFIFTSPGTSNITVTAFHVPGLHAITTFSFGTYDEPYRKWLQSCTPLGVCVGSSNVQSSLEFEVPFFTPMSQLETNSGGNDLWWFDGLNSTGTIVLMIDNPNETTFKMNYSLYQAAGDDFGLNYVRYPPMMTMRNEKARTVAINDHVPYSEMPEPIYQTTGPPTEDDATHYKQLEQTEPIKIYDVNGTIDQFNSFDLDSSDDEGTLKAHALNDFFKPNCFSKAEKFLDTAQGMLDTTKTAISNAISGAGPSTGGDDEDGGEPADDPDPLSPSNMNMIGGWLTSTFSTMTEFLGKLPDSFAGISFPKLTLPSLDFDLAGIVNALTSFASCTNLFTRACALYSILKMILGTTFTKFGESGMTLVSKIVDLLHGCMKPNEPPKAHAEYLDFAGPLSAILGIGTFVMTLARLPSTKEVTGMIKGISEKLRLFNFATLAVTNVGRLFSGISEVVQYLVEWVVLKLDPDWLPRIALVKDFDKIETWAAFIDSLKDKDIQDMVNYDIDFKNKVLKCVDQAYHYRALLAQAKIGREAKYIFDLTTQALEYGIKVKEAKSSLPIRIDPCCVCFFGPTGIGKSTVITNLAADIMDRLDYPTHNRWCSFNPTEKFASENYNGQLAIYIDDIAAFNTPEQWQNFFNLKSNTQFPLNMAYNKGRCFDSEFIFTTTNVPYPNPNCIAHQPALLRRRNILVEAAFATEELAMRARAGQNVVTDDCSHAVFRLCRPDKAQRYLSDWMTFDECVNQIAYLTRNYLQKQREIVHRGLTKMHYVLSPVAILPTLENPMLLDADIEEHDMDLPPHDPAQQLDAHAEKDDEFVSANEPAQVFSQEITYFPSSALMSGFSLFAATSPELIDGLKWNKDHFELPEDEEFVKEYGQEFEELKELAETQERFEGIPKDWTYSSLTWYLIQISWHNFNRPLPTPPDNDPHTRTAWQIIKEKLTEWKNKLMTKIRNFFENHKILKELIRTIAYALAAGLAFTFIAALVGRATHACMCATLTWFGYRCGVCGKWPKLGRDENHNAWMRNEWKKLYGLLPYEPGKHTSLEEENNLRTMQLLSRISKYESGTAVAHSTYSSTDVAGQRTVRVMANCSPQKANGLLTGPNQHVLTVRDIACKVLYTIRSPIRCGGLRMSGIAVGGRDLLLPTHFFTGCVDGDIWHIFHDGVWLPLTLDWTKIRKLDKKDACIVELPVRFHAHKDISKHFISEDELSYVKKTACTMVKLGFDQRNYLFQGDCERRDETQYSLELPDKERLIRTVNVFSYKNIPVAAGECGSLLLTHSSKVSGVILGFHVAGNDQVGMTTILTREMLKTIMTGTQRLGTPIPEVAQAHCSNLIPPGHFGRVGTVSKDKMIVQSCKTQIIPTKIFEKISKHVTEPSVLTPKDERLTISTSPLRKGISKYGNVAEAFKEKNLDLITDYVNAKIDTWPRIRPPQVLTLEEAIQGFPAMEGYEALPMDTSPGWPYVLHRPKGETGKGYLFDSERTTITDPELKKRFDHRLAMAKKGERVESVWIDCLKDERRPLAKIASGSTRVFTIPPVDFSILMRMYTLDFCEAMKNGRYTSFSQVGMNTQSLEWTELFKRLRDNSNLCVAGDYAAYDGTIPPEMIFRFFCHVYYFLTGTTDPTKDPELWNVLMVLCDESIHTVHLAKDQCYVTHKGNKSGSPVTVSLNSLVGVYYICYSWIELVKQMELTLTLWMMDLYVEIVIYGDDNLFSIKADVINWFNQESISALLAQYGITYTNESKTGITKFKDLSSATFLKNGFGTSTEIPLIKVPLMSKDTIMELLNWTRIAPDQDALLMDNINDALRFSYFYGREFFNDLRTRIMEALKSVDMPQAVCPYSDFHQWFLGTCGMV